MNKEQSPDLKSMSEEELRILMKDAEAHKDYVLQLQIYRLLLPLEERQCLAFTEIKELEKLIKKNQS